MTDTTLDPLLDTVLRGLSGRQKTLPPTLFYDDAGSALFEQITTLDEYYVTRAEAEVLRDHGRTIGEVAAAGAEAVVLLEPGCGGGAKAASILRHLPAIAYVGIDVSVEALHSGAAQIAEAFPRVRVHAVEADYHCDFRLPELPEARRIAFFPGSTIGNFDPDDAIDFLGRLRALVGADGRVIIGVDLWKDAAILRAAYDDRDGVTAAFDKNALAHLNARYDADFDLDRFDHFSRVDPQRRRVEMHLRARVGHAFHVAGQRFHIERGETIHTENAYKYDVAGFAELAASAGLAPLGAWTDARRRFGVFVFAR